MRQRFDNRHAEGLGERGDREAGGASIITPGFGDIAGQFDAAGEAETRDFGFQRRALLALAENDQARAGGFQKGKGAQ